VRFGPGGLEDGHGEIRLPLEELEAVRLVDLEGMLQAEAAKEMGVSQPTLNRILKEARTKIAEALVQGKWIRIEGGDYEMVGDVRVFLCYDCHNRWSEPYGTGRPARCPVCGSVNLHRAPEDRGWSRGGTGRRGNFG